MRTHSTIFFVVNIHKERNDFHKGLLILYKKMAYYYLEKKNYKMIYQFLAPVMRTNLNRPYQYIVMDEVLNKLDIQDAEEEIQLLGGVKRYPTDYDILSTYLKKIQHDVNKVNEFIDIIISNYEDDKFELYQFVGKQMYDNNENNNGLSVIESAINQHPEIKVFFKYFLYSPNLKIFY